ncbi:MAG: tetratricopeptide repeat protein [Microscillaceae bacterium]|nr:tetratricopeptide repeat protein [Microscillaceae bacterium]
MHLYLKLFVLIILLSPRLTAQTQTFESYYNQGREKLKSRDFKRAVVDFTIALEIDERAEAYVGRAQAKQYLEDHTGALQDYTEALRLSPHNAVIYNSLGNIYDSMRNPQDAILSYDKSLSLDSTYTNAYYNRAIAFFNVKNYQRAKEDFLKVVQLSPEDSEAWIGLGLSQYELDEKEQACTSFLKAQKLNISMAKEYLGKYCQ